MIKEKYKRSIMRQWINELREGIIEEDDQVLFNEATSCLQNGLNRASYILSWIMIVESLKRKIKLFSNLGDKRATEAHEKIEKAEDEKVSTDKLIYEESQKCGILDGTDISTITFLWQQRCLFAHPYNKQPEEDEVRHIITQGIKLVLAKEVLYSKDFLTELVDNIATKPFYLPTETDKIREYAKNIVARTPKTLHPFFFKTVLFKIGQLYADQEKSNELRKLRFCLVELFVNTPINLDNNDWSLENRVTRFPYECFVGFVHQETWLKFPERIKEMLIDYLVGETENSKLIPLKSIGNNLVQNDVLKGDLKEKYFNKLDSLKYDSAINFYGCDKAKFNRTKSELESWQYDQQNPVIDHIKSEIGIKWITNLGDEDLLYLGRLIRTCASGGHWKTQYLIPSIINGSIVYPDKLKAGLALSAFISRQDKFSLSKDFVLNAVKLLNQFDDELQNEVYDKIKGILDAEAPDELDKDIFIVASLIGLSKDVIENIDDLKEGNKENFENLIEAIKKYFA